MSKKEEKDVEIAEVVVAPPTDRELRWAAFLKAHAKQNPEKHQARIDAGELLKIPPSFQ